MTNPSAHRPDPLIDEVRQRRRELFAACDYDLKKLGALIQELQAQHPEKVFDRRRHLARTAGSSEADSEST